MGVDRVVHRLRERRATTAVVHDARAHVAGVGEPFGDVGRCRDAFAVEDAHRHQSHVPRHTGDADAVVARGADDAGDVRAVAQDVARVVVGIGRRRPARADHVPPVPVVDIAVVVVVDAVVLSPTAALAGIDPHVRREVGMVVRDAAVDDGDDDVGAAGRHVPRLRCVDVVARGARDRVHALPGVA